MARVLGTDGSPVPRESYPGRFAVPKETLLQHVPSIVVCWKLLHPPIENAVRKDDWETNDLTGAGDDQLPLKMKICSHIRMGF